MPDPPEILAEQQFIQTCVKLKLLSETDAESVSQLISKDSFVGQAAVQRGLLTPADVDLVQSLLRPLDVVPGYRILGMIGRGGMGIVYRAEQIDLEKTVALKTILISNLSDPLVAARFEREAKALARLQHPNIVQALNFGKHEGRYYFAMEYVPGLTCEQALNERSILPAAEVWPLVRQVASGLMHALHQNLIHRDIKPANLILLPAPEGSLLDSDVVKIADFGLAMFADQGPDEMKLTTADKIMGSPAYMSLEQFEGQEIDFHADMYSLGVTAWHLLFGKPPFRGKSVTALFVQKMKPLSIDPSSLPVTLPDDQMRLLKTMMDPDPNQRPKDYGELIKAVDALGVYHFDAASENQLDAGTDLDATSVGEDSMYATLPISITDGLNKAMESSNDSMSQTIDIPRPASPQKWNYKSRWILIAALAIFVLAAISAALIRRPQVLRTHTIVSGNTPLFDGITLSGWDVGGSMIGAWNTIEAPDFSTAIACTTPKGALTRRFPEVPFPRISLFVWLQPGGEQVDIDFAFDPLHPSNERGCLRLSAKTCKLGMKSSDFGELDAVVGEDISPTFRDRYHVVHLERQANDWFVFLEEQLVGTLPISEIGRSDAIRLVVHEAKDHQEDQPQAYFADVQLYQLSPTK